MLAALEHDHRWDARNADVIVGTSAGAITGALLRSGISATELAAWALKARQASDGRLGQAVGEEFPELVPLRLRQMLGRLPGLPGWQMVRHAVLQPWQIRPLTAALTLLAPGRLDISAQLVALREVVGESRPGQQLLDLCWRRSRRDVVLPSQLRDTTGACEDAQMSPRGRAVDHGRLARWCMAHLGSPPADVIFESGHLSAVIGLRLADDREVVVKVRPALPRVAACVEVQRRLFQAGYPCPRPLTGAPRRDPLAIAPTRPRRQRASTAVTHTP